MIFLYHKIWRDFILFSNILNIYFYLSKIKTKEKKNKPHLTRDSGTRFRSIDTSLVAASHFYHRL